jgi:tetratricopeptide (TPR) repeat protein
MRTVLFFCALATCFPAARPQTHWEGELRDSERLFHDGNYGGAATLLQRLVAESETFPANDPRRGIVLDNLGVVRQHLGDYRGAERLLLRSVVAFDMSFGSDHSLIAKPLGSLASVYLDLREYSKAEIAARRALALLSRASDSIEKARILNLLGRLHYLTRNNAEAEGELRQAHGVFEAAERYSDASAALNNLALVYQETNRPAEALRSLEQALAVLEREYNPSHPALIRPLVNLAVAYHRGSRLDAADLALRRAITLAVPTSGSEHARLGHLLTFHVQILRKLNRKDEARQVAKRAAAVGINGELDEPTRHSVDYLELLRRR